MAGDYLFQNPYIPEVNLLVLVEDVGEDVPDYILWPSIMSAFYDCHDFLQLEQLVYELKRKIPQLKSRLVATFSWEVDEIDHIA